MFAKYKGPVLLAGVLLIFCLSACSLPILPGEPADLNEGDQNATEPVIDEGAPVENEVLEEPAVPDQEEPGNEDLTCVEDLIVQEEGQPVQGMIGLPAVSSGCDSLAEALYDRVSHRRFKERGLNMPQVAAMLWAAGGFGVDSVTGATRTYPSAGATYPLELYLVAEDVEGLDAGIYRYDYESHNLQPVLTGQRIEQLAASSPYQGFIAEAPAAVVIVAHFERATGRYGERGMRYAYMDVGYVSQNIHLMVASLELGTVAVGAFDEAPVKETLDTGGSPVLIMPVGYPAD